MAVLYPYFNPITHKLVKSGSYKISRYACGKDYHIVLKKKLQLACKDMGNFRVVVDSTPFPERYYGRLANLGFIGKNGLLIHPQKGSYFFLAFVLFSKKIPDAFYKKSELNSFLMKTKKNQNIADDIKKYCKNCNRCVDACPTNAILDLGKIETKRCISYQTIESHVVEKNPLETKSEITSTNQKTTKKHRWIFGCDICQTVCPYNKKPMISLDEDFHPNPITKMLLDSTSLENQNTKVYSPKMLHGTPLKRIGMNGIIKNKKTVESYF